MDRNEWLDEATRRFREILEGATSRLEDLAVNPTITDDEFGEVWADFIQSSGDLLGDYLTDVLDFVANPFNELWYSHRAQG